MGRTWWIYIIIIYYCYCLRTFLKHWNYAHVQPYPHDLILRYFICQIHDVFPSLKYNMNIHSCLTQKPRDIWNSQIYIFRRAHPVVSHKIIVKSTQHQIQRLLTWLCEGCPLTWSVGYAAHTFTTCHGTYRNRLPIQSKLSLKAGQQSGCESLDVSSSSLTRTELEFFWPWTSCFQYSSQFCPNDSGFLFSNQGSPNMVPIKSLLEFPTPYFQTCVSQDYSL